MKKTGKTFVLGLLCMSILLLAACGGDKTQSGGGDTAGGDGGSSKVQVGMSFHSMQNDVFVFSEEYLTQFGKEADPQVAFEFVVADEDVSKQTADVNDLISKKPTGLFYLLDGAPAYTGEIAPAAGETGTIRLSTTTSVNDSGLLGNLLPVFEEKYGYTVEIQSVGTGKAIAAAKYGNADLILVHAKSQEEAFVEEGFSYVLPGFESERLSFLYNYFVLCGPSGDPAGVKDCASVLDAFAAIADGGHPFISRGDGSGTHTKELSLWPEALGITAGAESFVNYTGWYTSANAGMGVCLMMAEEMQGYILTDKATFLTFQANGGIMN